MSDYSNFPFQEFSTEELVIMILESVLLGDEEFEIACREEIKRRPNMENKNEHSQSQDAQDN